MEKEKTKGQKLAQELLMKKVGCFEKYGEKGKKDDAAHGRLQRIESAHLARDARDPSTRQDFPIP